MFLRASKLFKQLRYTRNTSRLFVQSSSATSDKNVIKSTLPDIIIPETTITEFVLEKFEKWPNKIATKCVVTGRQYTYEEVLKRSRILNKNLRRLLKLEKGDVVAILLPNVPEYPIAAFGAMLANLTVTTISALLTPDEIGLQLKDSNARTVITLVQYYDMVKGVMEKNKFKIPVITIKDSPSETIPEGAINFTEFTRQNSYIRDPDPGHTTDVAYLPYSSGTTGRPKGIQLTHHNVIASLCQIITPQFSVLEEATECHQDIVPLALPMYHLYGFHIIMLHGLLKGCQLLMLPKYTPVLYTQTLEKYGGHVLYIVPPMVRFLTNNNSIKKKHLSMTRTVFSAGSPLGAWEEQRFQEKFGKSINMLQAYGLTETCSFITMSSTQRTNTPKLFGTVGELIPNTSIKVVPVGNPKGEGLGPNQSGELLVKGPQVMRGYLNKKNETEESFVDGWLRTGDLVHYDSNHMLYIIDRLKEIIKVKGFQVAPAELEEVLRSHPQVADAAVVGVPHPLDGERPKAFIVPNQNTKIDLKNIQDFVSAKVAKYKQLKGGIEIVDVIPKTNAGKILRRQLKKMYLHNKN